MDSDKSRLYGILAGIATVCYTLLFYFIQPRFIFHLGIYWSSLIIPVVAMVAAGWKARQATTGEYPWQLALRSAFVVYAISALMYHLFYFVLFNFAAPELAQIQQEVLLENLEKTRDLIGARNADTLQRELESSVPTLPPGTALLAFARSLLGGFLLALLTAFALRKE